MEKCLVCGSEFVKKRKDTFYCRNPQCRKQAHLARKEQAAKLPPTLPSNKASVVVAFPDGSRWLLELTPLHAVSAAQMPTLTQVPNHETETHAGSDPAHSTSSPALSSNTEILSDQIQSPAPSLHEAAASTEISLDPIQNIGHGHPETVPTSEDTAVTELAGTQPLAPTLSKTDQGAASPPPFQTVELYFEDIQGNRMAFSDAVRVRRVGEWRVGPRVRVKLGRGPQEGYGLGGTPGHWQTYFGGRSPSEYGQDADVGVLYGDERAQEVRVARTSLLREALGSDWKERVRWRDS